MNAVEIEEAVSDLAAGPFDAVEFPFRFLAAFGNKEVTIKRLRSRSSNLSDVVGGVLQRNNIHLAVASDGQVSATLAALRASPKTGSAKAKFILATDGATLEAEDRVSGDTLACPYAEFGQDFGFFLPLAGISTVKEIKNNPIDVKATGRLNKLYVELLKDNPDWATEAKRPALNQFMARLIFSFFAEDTGIFHGSYLFTPTIERISDSQSGNTHEVVGQLFRAMGTQTKDRTAGDFRSWADGFPYVNGGLFTGDADCPRFSKIARAYLLSAGALNWKEINPDIFGSMIQAVADDEERGALGMHYTSVPNILKVLNPLFIDDLREQLEVAGDNARKLRNLRRRLATIRVFDPACGSGNFLVIAYLHMREIEAEIVRRTDDEPRSMIRLNSFYGIEIKGFAAEIARLALLIAEFQADCRHIGQQEARSMVLPLHKTGQIHVGNALRLDWLQVCPPVTKSVLVEHDLAGPTGWLALEENGLVDSAEPETFICSNPPYKGSTEQNAEQKKDLEVAFRGKTDTWKSLDYVSGWFVKFAQFTENTPATAAFVSTNSITQGEQVARLWPIIFSRGLAITFAHTAFKWTNLATHNAGVTVIVVGIGRKSQGRATLYENDSATGQRKWVVPNINAYLIPYENVVVDASPNAHSCINKMTNGNKPADGGNLVLTFAESECITEKDLKAKKFIRRYVGSVDSIHGLFRACIWINKEDFEKSMTIPHLKERIDRVSSMRLESTKSLTIDGAQTPYAFQQVRQRGSEVVILVPSHSSAARPYLPISLHDEGTIVSNSAFALFDAPLWNFALLASRIHLVWIAAVCGRIKMDYRYSSTLGWNTFPVPPLTAQDKSDLTRCANAVLLAREAHFPDTIADLYDPDTMPDDLRRAHEINDETLERIYIGRRFRNDTERLEKLFELYTKMIAAMPQPKPKARRTV